MFPDLTRDDVFRLETRRLWLRWPRQADAEAVHRLAGEKSVADMTASIPYPYSPDNADAFILLTRRANMEGRGLTLAITQKAKPGQAIGMVSIAAGADAGASLGYWLGQPFWGQGYATEAVQAMADALFTLTIQEALTADARVINPASRRVLEKCGFAYQGSGLQDLRARGGRYPVDHFQLTRRTWSSLKSWSREGYAPRMPEPALPLAAE